MNSLYDYTKSINYTYKSVQYFWNAPIDILSLKLDLYAISEGRPRSSHKEYHPIFAEINLN